MALREGEGGLNLELAMELGSDLKVHSREEIKQALLSAKRFDQVELISDDVAAIYAEAIYSELATTCFRLRIIPWSPFGGYPYPAYVVDDPRYNFDCFAFSDCDSFAVNVPGLSHGDLPKLGRALWLKQKLLGAVWPKEMLEHFLDSQNHLDVIEELIWLGRWHGVQDVLANKPNPNNSKDIDWEVSSCGVRLGIEVKHWRREWTGILDGKHKSRYYISCFDTFKDKFHRPDYERINLACISTYFPPDQNFRSKANEYLLRCEDLDGIVLYSSHATMRHVPVYEIVAKPDIRMQIEALFKPSERDESAKCLEVVYLARKKGGGIVGSVDEYIEFSGEEPQFW